nr:threonine/serine exporter family protein [Corynebacterium sp. sy017]
MGNRRGRVATIDAVKAAPPPSPLAPVDLTDPRQVAAVMDLAARIGDILLSSGTSNRDTLAHIRAVTASYGLLYCHVDITLNTITIFTTIGDADLTPVSVFRVVSKMTTDFSKLSEVDRLIRSIHAGATPPDVATKILDELFSSPAKYGFATSTLGWGALGACVSILLGGTALTALVSFFISLCIISLSSWLSRRSLPLFFQNIFGGFIATVPAALTYSIGVRHGIQIIPSHIIAAGIIVMLAGLTLVQALQDGITGAPVTASARFFETFLLTGAIVAGVGAGIQFSELIGITLPPLETIAHTNYATATAKALAGAAASAAFALACYAEISSVIISGMTALAGSLLYYFILIPAGIGEVTATAIAASVIGLAGGLLARRFLIPPLITAIAGITPMMPGLSIYRGMYTALNEQMLLGFTNMSLALSICCALAAGVVFGEWVARRLKRPPRINLYGVLSGSWYKGLRRRPRYNFAAADKPTHPDTQSFKVVTADSLPVAISEPPGKESEDEDTPEDT